MQSQQKYIIQMNLSPISNFTSKVELNINENNADLTAIFPNDPQSNIKINLKNSNYCLRRQVLSKHSQYFRKLSNSNTQSHELPEELDERAVRDMLFILYGGTVRIERESITPYFDAIQYFQIKNLLTAIQADVRANIEQYDIFDLLSLANKYQNQQIFSLCIEQLQRQKFQQIKYSQQTLLHLQNSLFKLILKSHNQYKKKHSTNISYPKISQFLTEYCLIHKIDDICGCEMKFQIFDITVLSSADYKEIFMEEITNTQPESPVSRKFSRGSSVAESQIDKNNLESSIKQKMNESLINSMELKTSHELKMKIIITFLNKRNKQLEYQNCYLAEQLAKIKKLTQQNQEVHNQMKVDIQFLKQQISKKQTRQIQNKKILNQIEPILAKLQKQIEKKSEQIDRLMQNQINGKKSKQSQKEKPVLDVPIKQVENSSYMPDSIVQSQFLSANFIHQMFSGPHEPVQLTPTPTPISKGPMPKKNKKIKISQKSQSQSIKYDDMKSKQLQQLYIRRIQFDEEPKSLKKSELLKICNFLPNDFNKKSLKLIYRRSLINPKKGQAHDIRGRNHLLVLISTQHNLNIGGYISIELPKKSSGKQILEDKNSFLFSITHQKKFPINTNKSSNAIVISEELLIGFGEDIQISKDCLLNASTCKWPLSYADGSLKKDCQWLAGSKDFFIRNIEIYQIQYMEMEMVL